MLRNANVGLTSVHAQVYTMAVNSRGMQNNYMTAAKKTKPASQGPEKGLSEIDICN